jgi:nicotinate-nucleotide pyrophosphorylase
MHTDKKLLAAIRENVAVALREDIGDGDLTAALIGPATLVVAVSTPREPMVMAGRPWVDEVWTGALDPERRANGPEFSAAAIGDGDGHKSVCAGCRRQ